MLKIDCINLNLDEYWNVVRKENFSKPTKKSINTTLCFYQTKLFNNKRKVISLQSLYCFLQNNNNLFKKIFGDIKLKDIILLESDNLNNFVVKIEKEIATLTKDEQKRLKVILTDIFQYSKFQGNILAPFFEKNLNPRTCYYCNIDFINVYDEENHKNKFTLDHFIDKGRYPYLALSIFNLIPCCSVCNSKVKGSTPFYEDIELKDTNPYLKSFKFDEKVKFKLFLHKNCKDLNIKSKDDIDIPLKERYSNEYEKYIEVFKLNERYQAHKDTVFEMIKNVELYPESRLKELQDLTGIPYQQIKQDIFNLIDDEVDLSKEPFSKLKRDMARELGL